MNQYAALKAVGFEQITVSTTAVGFTPSKLKDPNNNRDVVRAEVVIDATANTGIRHRRDGTAPTSSVGTPTPIATFNIFTVNGIDDCRNFQAIRGNQATPADTVLNVTYFA